MRGKSPRGGAAAAAVGSGLRVPGPIACCLRCGLLLAVGCCLYGRCGCLCGERGEIIAPKCIWNQCPCLPLSPGTERMPTGPCCNHTNGATHLDALQSLASLLSQLVVLRICLLHGCRSLRRRTEGTTLEVARHESSLAAAKTPPLGQSWWSGLLTGGGGNRPPSLLPSHPMPQQQKICSDIAEQGHMSFRSRPQQSSDLGVVALDV